MDKTHIVRIHHPSGRLYESWCDFVGSHPDASFFQSDVVFRLARTWQGAEALLLLLLDGSHQIQGSLLAMVVGGRSGFLSRFINTTLVYGGPLLAPRRRLQEHMNLDVLMKALVGEVKHRSKRIRFVNMRDWSDHQPVYNANGFSWLDGHSLLLGTSHKAKAWGNLSEEGRSRITSSLESGATIIEQVTPHQVDAFYDLLHKGSSKKARKVLPSRAFFRMLREGWRGGEGESGRGGETLQHNDFVRTGLGLSRNIMGNPVATGLGLSEDLARGREGDGEVGLTAFGTEVFEMGGGAYGSGLAGAGSGELGFSVRGQGGFHRGGVGGGVFVLVAYQGRIVGGAVCPVVSGRLMQGWLVAGLDEELGKQGVYPGLLAVWGAMKVAVKYKIPYVSILDRAVLLPGGLKTMEPLLGGNMLNYGRLERKNFCAYIR